MAVFTNLGKYKNTGLLILRIGIGVLFMLHGFPKLAGGEELWTKIGGSMKILHIPFFPAVWGFLAAITETFGGFLFVLGLAFRPVCLALAFTMAVAALTHFNGGGGISEASHALEDGIVFISLVFIGPGKYSIDKK